MRADWQLFEPADLGFVRVRSCFQPALDHVLGLPEAWLSVACNDYSWTGWGPCGNAWAACGILESGEAWAFVDPDIPPDAALSLFRKTKEVLDKHRLQKGPVSAKVDPDVDAAVKWATALGFTKAGIGRTWIYR